MKVMYRKFIVGLSLFLILLALNLIICLKIYSINLKTNQIRFILSEIEQSNDLDKQFQPSSHLSVMAMMQTQAELSDSRVANLKNFFRKHNSPLFDYAELIVAVSDQYHFDYRLLPAIAMQESNLCKYIPESSYNCWGWGIYGNSVIKFANYKEAIETVAKGLKEHYLDQGLITASAIMQKYTPSSNGSWQYGVNTFLKMLE